MECHKCPDYMKHQGKAWEATPCAKCHLADDSRGTMSYREADPANASWDHNQDDEMFEAAQLADGNGLAPYQDLALGDPSVPLSVLADAMRLWISLSLPARKVIQMRIQKLPFSEIGKRLGISRQGSEKLVAQALAKQPLLQNLLPGKSGRGSATLSATHAPAMAEHVSSSQKRTRVLHKPRFVPNCATRDSA